MERIEKYYKIIAPYLIFDMAKEANPIQYKSAVACAIAECQSNIDTLVKVENSDEDMPIRAIDEMNAEITTLETELQQLKQLL